MALARNTAGGGSVPGARPRLHRGQADIERGSYLPIPRWRLCTEPTGALRVFIGLYGPG